MSEFLKELSPQQRDRMMQVFLAQARGPRRNGDLLRQSVDLALQMQATRIDENGKGRVEDALVESLVAVTSLLSEVGAAYAVAGSIASSIHGEPRSSVSVELVVSAVPQQVHQILRKLQPRFRSEVGGLRTLGPEGSFLHLIDLATSLEVELTFIGGRYLRNALRRRMRLHVGGAEREFWFVAPEDVILMGLLCQERTQSAKQWENALSVARVREVRMDWKYLFEQARELGIEDDLVKLRDEAGI